MAYSFIQWAKYAAAAPGQGEKKIIGVDIVGDGATYAAGGTVITSANVGLARLDFIVPIGCGIQGSGVGLTPHWDRVNGKLKLYKSNTASPHQEAAAADFGSSSVCSVLAFGE
jgi:hypothetical protein